MSQYWKPEFSNDGYGNPNEYIRELEERLSESVSLRMISDVPLGAFLSGGMDSSTIVALMSQKVGRLKTFSIGFKETAYDETPYAKLVARKFGLDHHSFIVEPESLDVLPKIVWQLDEPFGDASVLPTYFVSKIAREYVKVCLSGDGGDEVFGGYYRYIRSLKYRYWDLLPISMRKIFIGPLYEKWPDKKVGKGMLERVLAERNDRTLLLLGITPENKKRALYKDCFYHRIKQMEGTDSPITLPLFSRKEDYLSQMQLFDMQYYLPGDILEKVDKMSMLNSLEVRIPILDHHVVEFMGKMPSSLKTTNLNTKILFKKMARKLLPKEIIKRKKKGFSVPLKYWFKENLDEFVNDILLDERCLKRGIFKRRSIEDYITNQKTGSRDFGLVIWRLLILELWFREYHDNWSFS